MTISLSITKKHVCYSVRECDTNIGFVGNLLQGRDLLRHTLVLIIVKQSGLRAAVLANVDVKPTPAAGASLVKHGQSEPGLGQLCIGLGIVIHPEKSEQNQKRTHASLYKHAGTTPNE